MEKRVAAYFATLAGLPQQTRATTGAGAELALADGLAMAMAIITAAAGAGRKLMFVGNGGSAGIASHMAIDYSKNGGMPATAFNDGSLLTCLGNDLGFENVFSRAVEMFGLPGDVLVAISSSGRSPNILNAVAAARRRGCPVLTLSGFSADNPLRRLGDVNFFVDNGRYGFVEIQHLTLIHAMLDLIMEARGETL